MINKIYNECCLKTMSRMEDDLLDLIILDPPYYEVKGDFDFKFESRQSYFEFITQVLTTCVPKLKPTGSLFCYTSQEFSAEYDLLLRDILTIKNRIIWYRSGGVSPKKKYKQSHEHLFYCVKDIKQHTWNLDVVRVKSKYAGKDKRLNPLGKSPDDVWEIPNLVGRKKEKVNHPTQKPLRICERIIRGSSDEGNLVYVPFAGSGSELVSCKLNDRNYIGSEISEGYCNLCEERLREIV